MSTRVLVRAFNNKIEPPLIYGIVDEKSGLQAYLAIDSIVNRRFGGGLKMLSNLDPNELAEQAHIMTLKHGFLGLPIGGSKAGICADPEISADKKHRLFTAFGKAVKLFLKDGSYAIGTDMGTTVEDIKSMLLSLGLNFPRRVPAGSEPYVALTVVASAIAGAQYLGLNVESSTVAVQGFGKIGKWVAYEFWRRGMKVVAISTSRGALYRRNGLPIDKLVELHNQVGDRIVWLFPGAHYLEADRLLELPVDVLSPCAISYAINRQNAKLVVAKIISPGANLPTTPEAEQILLRRGTLSLPGFVANCGGILVGNMKYAGLKNRYIRNFVEQKFSPKVTSIIQAAVQTNTTCSEYAKKIAIQKFLETKVKAEKKSLANKTFNLALELYRKGYIPDRLVALLAPKYFESRI